MTWEGREADDWWDALPTERRMQLWRMFTGRRPAPAPPSLPGQVSILDEVEQATDDVEGPTLPA